REHPGNIGGLENIAHDLFAILYNKPYQVPKPKAVVSLATDILQQYVGEYELAPNFIMTVRLVNNGLTVQPTGQRAFNLYAESDNKFFMREVEASATFIKSSDGSVQRMDWSQGGRIQQGKKIK
ncbi:MAG: DUF3471 domain-containing protein, partial [Chitinophagaceae bacterium]